MSLVRPFSLALLLLLTFTMVGCGAPDRAELDRWAGSEAGNAKLEAYAANPEGERDLRLHALVLLAEQRLGRKARAVLEKLKDRDEMAVAYRDLLLKSLGEGEIATQSAAKDALLALLALFPEEKDKDGIRAAVAKWAFAGLGPDTPREQLQKKIQERVTIGQVTDLGTHGVTGAVWLLSHGFATDRLYVYLHGQKDPKVDVQILRAFEKMHATPDIDIPDHHLGKIQDLRTPLATLYLMRLSRDEKIARETRGLAWGLAIQKFKSPEMRDKAAELLPELYGILDGADDDDRRLAIHYILRFGGVAELSKVLVALKDDGAFRHETYDTTRFALDICRDDVLKLRGDILPPLLETLEKGTRVSKILTLVCLKLSSRPEALAAVEKLTADETDLADILGEGMTLGRLAQNVVDSVEAISKLTARRDAGKLSEEAYEATRALYEDEVKLIGKELHSAIKSRAKERKKKVRKGEELP